MVEKEPARGGHGSFSPKRSDRLCKVKQPPSYSLSPATGWKTSLEKDDTLSPHFSVGMRLQYRLRFKEALAAFEVWLMKEPKKRVPPTAKGLLFMNLGDYDGAIKVFEESLR